jgi:nucleoside diphosphate kinase
VTDEILASDTANVTVESGEEPTEPTEPTEPSVTFEDQSTEGSSVSVASVSNNETPYYTAVWTVDETTGEPEILLGATESNDTEATDVAVAFDQSITENQTLVAAVHPSENGTPVTDEILASDTANVTVESGEEPTEPTEPTEPSVTFEDQSTEGSSVSVANVSNSETPYFTAVWTVNESSGEPEVLLGAVEINETDASAVSVTFDQTITADQTLVAAIHPSENATPVTDEILASDTANVTVESGEEPSSLVFGAAALLS